MANPFAPVYPTIKEALQYAENWGKGTLDNVPLTYITHRKGWQVGDPVKDSVITYTRHETGSIVVWKNHGEAKATTAKWKQ